MIIRHGRRRLPLVAVLVPFALTVFARAGGADVDELLRFGTEMARGGQWREAKFRWEQALKESPGDARLLNNLAVAEEVLGTPDAARERFAKAVAASDNDSRIARNAAQSALFWGGAAKDEGGAAAQPGGALPGTLGKKKGRDVVELPVPPRLKLDGVKTLLVVSFLVNDSDLLDVNKELVRFLRSEFRKHTSFDVLDVTPVPAVPEQTLEDMAKNAPFWTHLGREQGADVIVSGAMRYQKRDASGFQSVDIVSESTGQKIKQTQFVEQEEFTFELDVLYFRGADGSLLFRDRMRRQAVFRGLANDPISAFYELGNTIAGDVLAVVAPRTRQDVRFLFKG
jgi:hypothetical protein